MNERVIESLNCPLDNYPLFGRGKITNPGALPFDLFASNYLVTDKFDNLKLKIAKLKMKLVLATLISS